MFPSNIKSLKIRRYINRWRKFRFLARKNFEKQKTSTKEKLSRIKQGANVLRRDIAHQFQLLFAKDKDKPHPLEGVKIKYEQTPITMSRVASSDKA